jgi:hypothetical protein
MQCNSIQFNAIQLQMQFNCKCNALQYNAMQWQSIAMQYNTIQCNALQYNDLLFIALAYTSILFHSLSSSGSFSFLCLLACWMAG